MHDFEHFLQKICVLIFHAQSFVSVFFLLFPSLHAPVGEPEFGCAPVGEPAFDLAFVGELAHGPASVGEPALLGPFSCKRAC